MGLFSAWKPQGFHHTFIYTDKEDGADTRRHPLMGAFSQRRNRRYSSKDLVCRILEGMLLIFVLGAVLLAWLYLF